jgi:hypothetical protein
MKIHLNILSPFRLDKNTSLRQERPMLPGMVSVISMHRTEHSFGPSGLARVTANLTQGFTLR